MHEIKCVVDSFKRHCMGNQVVNIDLPFHVPIHYFRDVGSSASTSKGRAFPNTPSNQLERPSMDFFASTSDTNDDRDAPATMTTFKRLPHDIHIPNAFEAIIHTAVSDIYEMCYKKLGLSASDFAMLLISIA